MVFKIIGEREPTRLFVGGLHGKEGQYTEKILLQLSASELAVKPGRLILCSLTASGEYISTLEKAYYQSETGVKLLEIIRKYKPGIYVELHSYSPESYRRLTDPERKQKAGVPPLIELEQKLLIGSVSPLIRTSEFKITDLCLTLEIPNSNSPEAINLAVSLLEMIAKQDKMEILASLKKRYPEQFAVMVKNFKEYFGIK